MTTNTRNFRKLFGLAILTAALVFVTGMPAQALPLTYTVNTTADGVPGACTTGSGGCTLREAILAANLNPGSDTIKFSITGTIQIMQGDLPPLTEGVVIDGTTDSGQVGSNTTPGVLDSNNHCAPLRFSKLKVAIDANNTSVFTIDTMSSVTIKGLAIYDAAGVPGPNTGHAIRSNLGTGHMVSKMFIGVKRDGTDPGAAERNRGVGVQVGAGTTMTVEWSYVGNNGLGGIDGEASDSVLIARQNEVFKSGWNSDSHDNIDINGINSEVRCNLSRQATNNVGGAPVRQGDSGAGLEIGSKSITLLLDNNVAEYNTLYKNLSSGISIRKGARGDFVRHNLIWDNHVGISVNTEGRSPTNRNLLSQNSIFKNQGLGLDLQGVVTVDSAWIGNPDGITNNDTLCDVDPGDAPTDGTPGLTTTSNDLQNYPVELTAKRRKNKTWVQGKLHSNPNRHYLIEFFSTPMSDMGSSADREGKKFLAQTEVTTGPAPACNGTFSGWISSGVPDNHRITATARLYEDDALTSGLSKDPWSTSEFSNAIKPPQEDHDDFDSDGKRDDEDSDCDNDGRHNDEDSDDDNDGRHDDEDSDDDSDGVKDRHDSKGHKEKQDSHTKRAGGRHQASNSPQTGVLLGSGFAPLLLMLGLRKRRRIVQIAIIAGSAASLLLLSGVASSQDPDSSEYSFEITADANSLLLIAEATVAVGDAPIPDPDEILGEPLGLLEQPLVVEIYDPTGALVATSPPTPGPALATTVPLMAGDYTVKVRNMDSQPITWDLSLVMRENWDAPVIPPIGLSLGAAQNFALVAGGAITAASGAAPSQITGDLGVSPGVSITGFPPELGAVVVSPFTQHTPNAVPAIAAQAAVTALFTSLSIEGGLGTPIPAQLAGQNLGPGVYTVGAANLAAGGVLTLTGNGTYIFRTASTLVTIAGSNIILNGANPCKIWWQVGSSATLGGTTFAGNVVALGGVNSMGPNATLLGRLLTTAPGIVTMAGNNAVTAPSCAGN